MKLSCKFATPKRFIRNAKVIKRSSVEVDLARRRWARVAGENPEEVWYLVLFVTAIFRHLGSFEYVVLLLHGLDNSKRKRCV